MFLPRSNTYSSVHTEVQAGDTVGNTLTETAFSTSYPVQADTMVPGQVFFITAGGTYSTPASADRRIAFRLAFGPFLALGTSTRTPTSAAISGGSWIMNARLIISQTGTTGTLEGNAAWILDNAGSVTSDVWTNATTEPYTIDTTVENTIQLTVQYQLADASNTITMRHLTVQVGV